MTFGRRAWQTGVLERLLALNLERAGVMIQCRQVVSTMFRLKKRRGMMTTRTGTSGTAGQADRWETAPKVANVEAKIEMMLEYRELASQMRRRVASLTEQYPDQWAAMVPGGELFVAGTMDGLLAVLDEKGLRHGNVVIEYLDSDPTPLIP